MPQRERMSGADNAWRRLGTSDNLTTITAVLTFDEELKYDELRDQLERRLLRFDRFKQRLYGRKRVMRRPYWEIVEDFDIENHIMEINLPQPRDKATLQKFVSTLTSRPLDEIRPLWEAYLISDYDGGSAVVVRLNHCLGDGFALIYVLFGLADRPEEIEFPIGGISTPDRPEEERAAEAATAVEGDTTVANGGSAVTNSRGDSQDGTPPEPTDRTSESTDRSDESSITSSSAMAPSDSEPMEEITHEGSVGDRSGNERQRDAERDSESDDSGGIIHSIKLAGKAAKTALGLLTMDDEPQTSLHDSIGTTKRVAWTKEMPVDDVKAVGRVHDATINDVLLAATAGVFHETLESRGEDTEGLDIRCSVPVNLKPMEHRDESLGNYFGLAFVPIPVDDRDLDDRIRTIRDRADPETLGIQAFIMYYVLTAAGRVPEQVFNALQPLFEDSATAVVSNVPGPLDPIHLAGKEVNEIMFWNPQAMDMGLSVSIFTYRGTVQVGVYGDANLIPEPEELTDEFEAEIDRLVDRYLE